ncbi:MAG: FAD-dependent oxidoreductase [Acidobacteriota bacterium]
MRLKHLFSPIQIGSMCVKNRIALPSMGLVYTQDGSMTDRIKQFYYERARGGAGLLITGPYSVDKAGGGPTLLGLDEDRFVPELRSCNEEIHGIAEVKVACQLFHAGRYSFSEKTGEQAVSASAIPSRLTGETPKALTICEIRALVEQFRAAAARAREAGFDAVEILASAGYLVSQFLSPVTNIRTDEYGGSCENRMRFLLEIVATVRREIGAGLALLVRVAGHDYMPGGLTSQESRLISKRLEEAGVDAVNVTGGWHETRVPQVTYAVPPGAFVHLARRIKEVVSIPVFASNRLGSPELAERVLREGSADVICMGRPLIADPHLPNKAKEGRFDEIMPCIACNELCFDHVFTGKPVGCMLNPMAGHEGEVRIRPAEKPKRVVVAGGGPAGLMSAVTAARRGHKVVLLENEREFGGQILLGAQTPDKGDFARVVSSLVQQARSAGAILKGGVRATAESVEAEHPDAVIVATGAHPSRPSFSGANHPKVLLAWDILRGNVEVAGRRVVVVGGSATGCETALKIAKEGTLDPKTLHFLFLQQAEELEMLRELATRGTREVTVVEVLPRLAVNMGRTTRWILLQSLESYHVKMVTDARVTAVTDEGVDVERDGKRDTLYADTVVLATGVAASQSLYNEIRRNNRFPVFLVGDAREPRRIVEAIHEGFHVGLEV